MPTGDKTSRQIQAHDGMSKRVLWLYGLHTILWNVFFLVGYYLLPEGFMRGSPQAAVAELASRPETFWPELGLTLLFNLGMVTALGIVLNFNQVRGVPVGYLIPIVLGIVGGLFVGTNSFVADDLSRYSVREGMALGLTIGGLEMFGYILVIASTVGFGIYQYRSWWRWSGEWKPTKVMNLRDVRLSKRETLSLVIGILLILVGAYRETMMAMDL